MERVPRNDLLCRLLNAVESEGDEKPLSNRQLRDELVTLLLAGHETSAAGLTWAMWLLAKHPEVQDRVAQALQVEGHVGFEQLARLGGVEQIFKEALRLYPPVYFLSRETSSAVEVAGYLLRPSSQVFLVPYLTHHDQRWFADPEEFNPLRFTEANEADLPACGYFPFGAGPRACVGRGFAMLEGVLVLAAILRRFQLRLVAGEAEPELAWQLSLHPRSALRLAIEPRAPRSE